MRLQAAAIQFATEVLRPVYIQRRGIAARQVNVNDTLQTETRRCHTGQLYADEEEIVCRSCGARYYQEPSRPALYLRCADCKRLVPQKAKFPTRNPKRRCDGCTRGAMNARRRSKVPRRPCRVCEELLPQGYAGYYHPECRQAGARARCVVYREEVRRGERVWSVKK